MSPKTVLLHSAICIALFAATFATHAADVTVQPATGSGFVVKDAAGANERLRVQESGAVTLSGVPSAAAQSTGLCMSGAGLLGPCNAGSGSGPAYTAATGLSLTGTTFAILPTFQLPQTCTVNQIAQWNGTGWVCAAPSSGGGTLPVGTVNQTLRYNAGGAPVANSELQVFADGGVLATDAAVNATISESSTATGAIPASGPGARMMWYPAKAAFRAGYIGFAQWDDANVGRFSTALGANTTASGEYSIAMGRGTTASGKYSTTMGVDTTAGGDFSTAMGYVTNALGNYSIAMGDTTKAIGDHSIAMGTLTEASGGQSTAMGIRASTDGHKGAFIYGDGSYASPAVAKNDADYQFTVVASGGFKFVTNPTGGTGALLAPNNGSWTAMSDRNAKTAVVPVDARTVLDKVAAMPLATWQYKAQDAKYRHMGPMAQDFRAAFGLGESDTGIDTVDADGVALAAIQGLNAKLEENLGAKDREIAALQRRLATQDETLAALGRQFAEVHTQLQALQANPQSRIVHAEYPRRRREDTIAVVATTP